MWPSPATGSARVGLEPETLWMKGLATRYLPAAKLVNPEIEARQPHRIAPIRKQPTESDRHAQPRDLLTWTLRLYLKYLVSLRAGLSESETAFLDRIAGDDDGFGGGRHPGCPPGLLGACKRLGVQRSLVPSAWPTLDRRDGQSD